MPSPPFRAKRSLGTLFFLMLTLTLVILSPSPTHAKTLDPRYPGTWEILQTLSNGTYHLTYTVTPDGYFALTYERPTDDPITDEGTLEATNGIWTARSVSGATSHGRYEFPDENTLVTTTFLGNSRWTRTVR